METDLDSDSGFRYVQRSRKGETDTDPVSDCVPGSRKGEMDPDSDSVPWSRKGEMDTDGSRWGQHYMKLFMFRIVGQV